MEKGGNRMRRLQTIYTAVFTACLVAFSVYALLDTFVITRVYTVVEQETEEQSISRETLAAHTNGIPEGRGKGARPGKPEKRTDQDETRHGSEQTTAITETVKDDLNETADSPAPISDSYSSDTVQIELTEYREYDSTIYVADIMLKDAGALKTAFAQNSFGRNVTADTSDTAAAVGAILAINGDNYGSRQEGYVIRNGVLYRETAAKGQEDLVIYDDGSFEIIREDEISARELIANGAVQVFSFGPGLIEEGEITVDLTEEVDRAKASNPRTAIGIIEEGHYVLVVSDGRTEESEGLTLYELAVFMKELGVQTAYNLDGGGSSTMVFRGRVVNSTTSGRDNGERAVTDIIYI